MRTEPFKEVEATIKRLAAESFKDHVLKDVGPGEFYLGKPGTSCYSFRLLFRPGMVCVWGDLGEWVLRHADRNSVGWFRGATDSPDYLLSKVQAGEKEEFYPADALAHLREYAEAEEDPCPAHARPRP